MKKLFAAMLLAASVALMGSTAKAAAKPGLSSAVINGNQIVITASAAVTSADGVLHLKSQAPYMTGAQGTDVQQMPSGTASFVIPLGKDTAASNLFNKFVVTDSAGNVLTNSVYIANPEVSATHTAARRDGGIKGILPASQLLGQNNLTDLGIKQITYNLLLGRICSGGGINYTYNGKTYSFSSRYVSEYDIVAQLMNKRGIQVTYIILNDLGGDPNLISPLAAGAASNYYGLNASNEAGVEKLEAVASFLGQRYGNTGHGTVDNWIVGNEVNAWSQWNYMNAGSLSNFANEYAKAFRILYNGIRSENANARIYVGTDQQWAVASSAAYYGSRPFLEAFNNIVKAEGNIDWRVAMHAYNVPLYSVNNWSATGYAVHNQNSRYVTMQNIDVLTDFLSQPSMLSPSGQVRTVKLSEQGFTSTTGEPAQAAAVTFGYMQAASNKYVDGFILSREMDDPGEIAQGLAVGLLDTTGRHKLAYEYYKHAGEPAYFTQASALAGTNLAAGIVAR
ncbi:MAG: DUF5722 domain-containing protein [Lachnospiraceae bacterium]|jgi:hypothetical protein|nr:DUF5722 domain-containing protein [Lachnospiraceae bacterium]